VWFTFYLAQKVGRLLGSSKILFRALSPPQKFVLGCRQMPQLLYYPMPETIFTKIINREIPAQIVYEDELALAFRDINPQAPTHILVIPKQPLPRLEVATPEDQALLGHLLLTVQQVAAQVGLKNGYRVVINNGEDGGQTVEHLHLHILGDRPLLWPPG
jgi:histidine triad (HIT) family protein